MALTSRIKNSINAVLNPVGLEVQTTRRERIEASRLSGLAGRGHWREPLYQRGLGLAPEVYLEFLRSTLAPYSDEYTAFPQTSPAECPGYFWDNGWFGPVDCEVYYSIIRTLEPSTIIEIGSGMSTRLARLAIESGHLNTRLICVDPQPREDISRFAHEHIESVVEQLEPQRLTETLRPNDILFIDSSHTVVTGGDVAYLFLQVLPSLKPGVLVHIHDIFLPFDYPQDWVVTNRWSWTEQYLVHAFLCFNNAFQILWPSYFMYQSNKEALWDAVPERTGQTIPSSLWLKKIS